MEEDIKRKNEQLEILLAENRLLKQHTQEQDKQVAKLEQKLEGNNYVHDFVVPFWRQNLPDT